MGLNSWAWLIAGGIISIMSGYVYLTIPKNGQPNVAMAIFFFVGIIFIVIGIAKLFFRRIDDKSVMDSIKNTDIQPKIVTMPNNTTTNAVNVAESRPNKVDETIAQMMQQEQQPLQNKPTTSTQSAPKTHHTGHTNSYAKMYEYKGPVHTPTQGVHSQHPVSQHVQQPQHKVQNTTEHSIKCKRCGNANTGSSNYCHQCGNRLK